MSDPEISASFPRLPDWNVARLLGAGATADVYAATRARDGLPVALKVIPLARLPDEEMRNRAAREATTLAHLRHPGIVRLHGVHRDSERLVLELEYVDGETLREWSARERTELLEPRLWILAKLAEALAYAHDEGVLHRDLKPSNVLVGRDGAVKLFDFGLAKRTRLDPNETLPGTLLGSLAYMAPETLAGAATTERSDVFSFGVIAYELCTGRHPFPHTDAQTLFQAWNAAAAARGPELPRLPRALEETLRDCLARDPQTRPRSLWSVHAALMGALHESGLATRAKELVAAAPEGDVWRSALADKHDRLRSAIDAELAAPSLDRKRALRAIGEFSILFPDSAQTATFLERLHAEHSAAPVAATITRPRLAILLLLATTVGAVAGIYYSRTRIESLAASALPAVETAPLASEAPAPSTPEPEPAKKPIATTEPESSAPVRTKAHAPTRPESLATGFLSLSAGADVRVFVDGRRYGARELEKLRLAEGSHQVLLERDGYLPIEQKITIRKGVVTRINTDE